ncbi:BTB/POZ domain-containing protein 2-like [Paramacrobiotus metropolitanus]|uniref:BTB/POZ domain-containing protein 2-like n=1 Tax=Paramacrobiotus metropolitanus TaxID=2943436 RepID=UPI0024459D60|nr:BTB/POZ domain-containing protein 2-like [Paramacrobiotus metropolitanus]XP_055327729.1 BTB/POZ domain-containing protein 2-like [Paramacrobiotus metropolitanus]
MDSTTIAALDWGWQGKGLTFKLTDKTKYVIEHQAVPGDVIFRVGKTGEEEDIPAHKSIISMGSAPFYAMFYGPAADKSEDCIRIPDLDAAAFNNLIRFLYTECTDRVTWENVMGTLACAKKYGVPALMTACRYFAQENISPYNACYFLVQARGLDENDLIVIALAIIDRQTREVFAAESFTDIDHDLLCEIISRDTLTINELDLYHAVHRWAVEECKLHGEVTADRKREVLGRGIGLVRFPLLTTTEIADGPAQDGILTIIEENNLYRHFLASQKPPLPYTMAPRLPRPHLLTVKLNLWRGINKPNETDEDTLGRIVIVFRTDIAPHACRVIQDICSKSRDTIRVHWGPAPSVNELEFDGNYESVRPHPAIPIENFVLKHAYAGIVSLESTSSTGDGKVDPTRWWICKGPEPEKDGRNMVVGKVTEGLEILDVAQAWISRPDDDGVSIWIESIVVVDDEEEDTEDEEDVPDERSDH